MTWPAKRTAAKYRSPEHAARRAALVKEIERVGYVMCTAVECRWSTRAITETDGRKPEGLHLGHEDDGIRYRGPEHGVCNLRDAGKRAAQRAGAAGRPPAVRSRDWW